MARPPRKYQAILENTKADMIALGIYEKEFDEIIRVYSQLKEAYFELLDKVNNEELNFRYIEVTESGSKKSTNYTVLESMRKDILSYANSLGLTPAGLKKLKELKTQEKISPTAKVLSIVKKAEKI